jgi:hypothetical protein
MPRDMLDFQMGSTSNNLGPDFVNPRLLGPVFQTAPARVARSETGHSAIYYKPSFQEKTRFGVAMLTTFQPMKASRLGVMRSMAVR